MQTDLGGADRAIVGGLAKRAQGALPVLLGLAQSVALAFEVGETLGEGLTFGLATINLPLPTLAAVGCADETSGFVLTGLAGEQSVSPTASGM
ncbi:MAG TPA: hypothetical protein VNL16_12315, partial [Chloroflexota bacterium]|nr:hypothetical protein [Chloroflexota bacterium]